MVESMKVNISVTKNTVKVYIYGKMEVNLKVIGWMVKDMEEVFTL